MCYIVHCSRSADVICNVLEIRSILNKLGKTMAKPLTALLERSFSSLSHLHCHEKSSHMKIQGETPMSHSWSLILSRFM